MLRKHIMHFSSSAQNAGGAAVIPLKSCKFMPRSGKSSSCVRKFNPIKPIMTIDDPQCLPVCPWVSPGFALLHLKCPYQSVGIARREMMTFLVLISGNSELDIDQNPLILLIHISTCTTWIHVYIYIILYPPVVHPANYRAATTLSRMDLKSKNVKEQSVNETNQKVAVRNWEPWAVWKRFRLQCNESKLSHTGVTWISLQALKEDDAGILKELDVVRCEEASCSVHSDLWPLALTSLYVTHLLIYSSLGSASLLWDPAGNIVLLSSRRTWSTTRTQQEGQQESDAAQEKLFLSFS